MNIRDNYTHSDLNDSLELCNSYINEINDVQVDVQKISQYVLFKRIVTINSSVSLLLEHNKLEDSSILLRSALESVLKYKHCCNDDYFYGFIMRSENRKKSLINSIINRRKTFNTIELSENLQKKKESLTPHPTEELDFVSLAEKAELSGFVYPYKIFNKYVHSDSDLIDQFITEEDNNNFKIENKARELDKELLVTTACTILFSALKISFSFFDLNVKEYEEKLESIYKEKEA